MEVLNTVAYYGHQFWIDIGDPRTADYFMVGGGCWKIAAVLLTYWLTVRKVLPAYMKNREPLALTNLIRVYNFMMVLFNLLSFVFILYYIDYGRIFLDFDYPDRNDQRPETMTMLYLGWISYMYRFLEMFETVFFALRKKYNQMTFLHVYHHMIVPFIGWFSYKLNPLVPIIILFLLFNSVIHVIMYSYYMLSSYGPKMQKYLWWKKYITQLQLIQFLSCGVYGIFLFALQTNYPMSWFVLAVGQNPIFFYMFYQFYKQSYDKKQKLNGHSKQS